MPFSDPQDRGAGFPSDGPGEVAVVELDFIRLGRWVGLRIGCGELDVCHVHAPVAVGLLRNREVDVVTEVVAAGAGGDARFLVCVGVSGEDAEFRRSGLQSAGTGWCRLVGRCLPAIEGVGGAIGDKRRGFLGVGAVPNRSRRTGQQSSRSATSTGSGLSWLRRSLMKSSHQLSSPWPARR